MNKNSRCHKPKLIALRWVLSVIAVACAFPALLSWSQEIWQRQLWLLRVEERWLAAVAGVCILIAVFAWPGGRRNGFWWIRGGAGILLCAVGFSASVFVSNALSVRQLVKHEEAQTERNQDLLRLIQQSNDSWASARPLFDWFEARGAWVPPVAEPLDRIPYHILDEPLEHLVETSRWRVRLGFMRDMMRDENRAMFLVHEWHRFFPAVTGQDVTLARRTEMLKWLTVLAHDTTAPQASRDAATFWMGLVVLTDTDAFAVWRVPVRDAMLACDEPPMCHSGDVWMRVLDVLLAFDSRDEAIVFTGKLLREPTLLRRALRERVRGMEGHMLPIMDEIERQDALETLDVPIAMWVDLRRLADRQHDSPERTEVQNRLLNAMAGWLVEDAMRVRQRFGGHRFGIPNIVADVILEMPDEFGYSLAGHAHGILEGVGADPGEGSLLAAIQHALMIWNFLDDERRVALSEKLSEVMLRNTATSVEDEGSKTQIHVEYLLGYAVIWDDLNDEKKHQFGQLLRSQLQAMDWESKGNYRYLGIFSSMHFMHHHAGFSEAEQLVIATYSQSQLGDLALYPECWWARGLRLEPMKFSAETIHAVVEKIESFAESGAKSLQVENGESAFEFPLYAIRRWLAFARSCMSHGLSLEDGLIAYLAEHDMVGIEYFPDSLPEAMLVRPYLLNLLLRKPERARLSAWFDDVQGADRILKIFENKPYHRNLSGLAAYLDVNPPNDRVLDHIHSYFHAHASSRDRSTRMESFWILLRMEAGMNPVMREKFRRDVHQFMERDRPTMSEMSFHFFDSSLHDRPGWILWMDDALSAEHGWREQVAGEIGFGRRADTISSKNTDYPDMLFNHLMFAMDTFSEDFGYWSMDHYLIDAPVSSDSWRTKPPELPLAPTPWQRARELYLKRPDLEFPDCGLFRPGRRAVEN